MNMNDYNFDPMTGQPIKPQSTINYQQVQQPIQQQPNMHQPIPESPTKKGSKKIIIMLIALVAILGIGIFSCIKIFGQGKSEVSADISSVFDPNKPIIVKNNGKYGYITSDGKMMIEPQYKSATDFYGDYAVVSVDNPDTDAYTYNDILYQIIDKNGNVKLTSDSYLEPEYYIDYDIWLVDDVLYDSNLNRMFSEELTFEYIDYEYFKYTDDENDECGIMTYKGKKIFTTSGWYIAAYISKNEYNEDDLYATVKSYGDSEKEVIISLQTGDILFTSDDPENYYIVEEENGLFYYYNHTLEDGYKNRKYLFFINNNLEYQITEYVYDIDVYDYQNQVLRIDYGYNYEELGKSQRMYYYDVKNKKMLDEKPVKSTETNDLDADLIERTYGFKESSCSGKYGIMSDDKLIVPCEYDYVKYLDINLFNYMKSNGKELILLEKDENLLLYDLKSSETITSFNSTYISDYGDSTFIKIKLYDEDSYAIKGYTVYNLLSGKSMDFNATDNLSIGSNFITITQEGKKIYYNTNFKQVYVSNES